MFSLGKPKKFKFALVMTGGLANEFDLIKIYSRQE